MPFSDQLIKNAKPRKGAYYIREKGPDRGFCIRVLPSGKKVFCITYVLDGKERFYSLGTYGPGKMSLAMARKACRAARELVNQGIDPRQHAKQIAAERERQRREDSQRGTVEQLFSLYINYLKSEKTEESAKQVAGAFRRDISQIIDPQMKAADIGPEHIRLILNRIAKRGALVQANRTRSYIMAAFQHGIEYDNNPMNLDADILFGLKGNPARDIPKVLKHESVGERYLSADEIHRFWKALDGYAGMSYCMKQAVRLMLAMSGQRVKEVAEMRWDEIDWDQKTVALESARTKNRRGNIIPLNPLALSILEDTRRLTGSGIYVFPGAGNPEGESSIRLTSVSRAISRFCERTAFEKFTPKDFRRTVKTLMGQMGVSKETRDRLQNHAMSDVSSVHYDRYDYLAEKRVAAEAWGQFLEGIIRGAEIVPFRAKR